MYYIIIYCYKRRKYHKIFKHYFSSLNTNYLKLKQFSEAFVLSVVSHWASADRVCHPSRGITNWPFLHPTGKRSHTANLLLYQLIHRLQRQSQNNDFYLEKLHLIQGLKQISKNGKSTLKMKQIYKKVTCILKSVHGGYLTYSHVANPRGTQGSPSKRYTLVTTSTRRFLLLLY